VDFVAANVLTPFPGTPLFEEMERSGRIIDKDWAKYDFNHVVFQPLHMSAEELQLGTNWVRAQLYQRHTIRRRLIRSFGYLDPGTMLKTVIPLNFGFRSRMFRSRTMQTGLTYIPVEV
jgi:hypothetical protein